MGLFLTSIYHSGKNSKPKLEKGIFPLVRTQPASGPEAEWWAGGWASQQVARVASFSYLRFPQPISAMSANSPPISEKMSNHR